MQNLEEGAQPQTIKTIARVDNRLKLDHVVETIPTIQLPAPDGNPLEWFLFGYALSTKGGGK